MDDKDLPDTIKKHNKIKTNNAGFNMRLLKRIERINKENVNLPDRATKEEDSIIMELDKTIHGLMLKLGEK